MSPELPEMSRDRETRGTRRQYRGARPLQNLQVQKGGTGKYEVVAGGRRLAALKLLAKRKAL